VKRRPGDIVPVIVGITGAIRREECCTFVDLQQPDQVAAEIERAECWRTQLVVRKERTRLAQRTDLLQVAEDAPPLANRRLVLDLAVT
jgi:hypothetical protein